MRERIFATQIDEAELATRRVCGDRHRLDEREGIALHDRAVFERAGFGFVGVADEIVRAHRLLRDRFPLAARRERGTTAAHELGIGDFANHGFGADLDRSSERFVPLMRTIIVEARRIDDVDAAQQLQRRVPRLR